MNYANAQRQELAYWMSCKHEPTSIWYYYDRQFLKWIPPMIENVLDIGCGPVPYFLNHNVRYRVAQCVDPLIHKYLKLPRYQHYYKLGQFIPWDSMPSQSHRWADVTFALNMLDHVENPKETLDEIKEATKGRLFIYCDIDKEPDGMHPHKLGNEFFLENLRNWKPLFWHRCKSWKFNNDVLFLVVERK